MSGACSKHGGGKREMRAEILLDSLKGRDHLEDLRVDGRY
jgi:hypothetical protein